MEKIGELLLTVQAIITAGRLSEYIRVNSAAQKASEIHLSRVMVPHSVPNFLHTQRASISCMITLK